MNFNELTDRQLCMLVARHEHPDALSVSYIDAMGCVCAEILNSGIDYYYQTIVLTHDLSSRLWERDAGSYHCFIGHKLEHTPIEKPLGSFIARMQRDAYSISFHASKSPRTRIVALCSMWYAGKEDGVNAILEKIDD